ncbi:AfsR/SARP family transcriptional regulator [Amycolatopsis sp. CA-230715]|uniref:AfsR/SARP family transcriptional regulator n=1 Tax=Amycolatopsis sp. CA-230715 TaxID=2745196 RepID=UPI001C02AD12|nr:BTAD domain-containing putative transcriptional regulator [Amycolatopsis sp. CA-230715]QWF78975.1 Regulatory protein AfsR [Amycolatopsis sp. CA-230715]
MDIRLLGPVEVFSGRDRVPTGRRQLRAVLAALAADAPRLVPTTVLIDRVWGEDPPARVRQAVWTRVADVRRVLGGGAEPRVLWRPSGYLLRVEPDQVDLHRFRGLTGAARRPGCPDTERVALLAAALELWQGPPLAGLRGEWVERQRESWQLERLDAAIAWARASSRIGQHTAVIPVLRALIEDHPYAEPVAAELTRALFADNRNGEAIAECQAACDRLYRKLGVTPGRELRALHRALLTGEQLPEPAAQPGAKPLVVPAQLTADVAAFAGRGGELARLDGMLAETAEVVIIAVSGAAGVGKSAFAVHWAHRVRDRFPDGNLYVDLRGSDRERQALDPAEATRLCLDALGVPAERVPAELDARTALYRSLLAGRRMLVVLDDAVDSAQVRPLLPGTSGCVVVVSSRATLTGLIAAHGARVLALGPLSRAEARELLDARLGGARTGAEPAAVADIITACACSPLALATAATRAVIEPRLRLSVLAGELTRSPS